MRTNSERTLKLVRGYVKGVDRLPQQAKARDLDKRFAFVLETYRPGVVDAFFDAELYEGLVKVTAKAFGATSLTVALDSGDAVKCSAAEFHSCLVKRLEVEREPFSQILIERDSVVVAMLFCEPWVNVGGPDPYHDSYTLALYTASIVDDSFEADVRALCDSLGAEITHVVQGGAEPEPPGWLASLKNAVGTRRAM